MSARFLGPMPLQGGTLRTSKISNDTSFPSVVHRDGDSVDASSTTSFPFVIHQDTDSVESRAEDIRFDTVSQFHTNLSIHKPSRPQAYIRGCFLGSKGWSNSFDYCKTKQLATVTYKMCHIWIQGLYIILAYGL